MMYEINEQNKKNMIEFLGRTTLKGIEVAAYAEIMRVLSNPVIEEEVKEKKK